MAETFRWLLYRIAQAAAAEGACSCGSVRNVEPDFRLEVVDWVVPNYWHSDLQRKGDVIGQITSHSCVKRKKEASGLSSNRIAEIHANVCARIKSDEPMVGKSEVEKRS